MSKNIQPNNESASTERVDDRPPQVWAMDLATRVISACMTPVLPPALGFWLDGNWGTGPWLLIAGLVFGLTAGIFQFRSLLIFLANEK